MKNLKYKFKRYIKEIAVKSYYILNKNKKKIFHMSTPIHGNMGDHAIVYATNKFLSDNFKDYKIIEVYKKDIYTYTSIIKKVINKDDFIVLIGGGNMGNLWIDEEVDRRFIIDTFKDNKIISMPQTISFTNDLDGEEELLKTKKIYNAHNNLTVMAREKKSYEIMKENFKNNKIILNPDMVLYLNNLFSANITGRNYIMTCLRNDKESLLKEEKNKFIDKLKKEYSNVIVYDTVLKREVYKKDREKELNKMFNKFRQAKVVITDRLHGMVFAAITKTPCIVTKSLDHKVTGTYEWIKSLNYIKLVDNLEYQNIKELIEELSSLKEFTEIDLNKEYYSKLKNEILFH